MCSIPTTVLWPSLILGLIVLLCFAQLPTDSAVILDHHQELIGTFLMELVWTALTLYHTTEVGLMVKGFLLVLHLLVEQFFSTVTLRVPRQESSAVRYVMPMDFFRASMWGYILPPQVSPVHWKETSCMARACEYYYVILDWENLPQSTYLALFQGLLLVFANDCGYKSKLTTLATLISSSLDNATHVQKHSHSHAVYRTLKPEIRAAFSSPSSGLAEAKLHWSGLAMLLSKCEC